MAVPTITDPFFRQLYAKLAEEIDNRAAVLVEGGALIHGGIGIDAVATAIKYQSAVAHIEALKFVVELGIQLDHDRYGNRTKTDDE